MNWIRKVIAYYRDNPEGYWFKRRLYGWGWMPVTWQGWLVVVVGVSVAALGAYIAEIDDAPGAALFGILLMIVILFVFCFWKGERPRWQWGLPKKERRDNQ